MAEHDATLADMLAQLSPAPAADNLDMVQLEAGPSDTTPGATPDADQASLAQRIAELEAVSKRHVQQLNGSRAEIERYQRLLEQEQQNTRQLLDQQRQLTERVMQTPQAVPEPELSLDEIIEKVALEGQKGLGKQWQAQLVKSLQKEILTPQSPNGQPRSPQGPVTAQDVETILTQRERSRQLQQAILQDLGTRHKDVIDHPQAAELLPQVYASLQQNPLMQALYPPDQSGASTIEWNGVQWDARLIDRAASEIRNHLVQTGQLKEAQRQTNGSLPAQSGGGTTGRPPKREDSVVIPAQYVRGEEALFNDPRVRKALEVTTGLKDPRSQVAWFFKNAPESVKAQWKRQATLQRPEDY